MIDDCGSSQPEVFELMDRARQQYERLLAQHRHPLLDDFDRSRVDDPHLVDLLPLDDAAFVSEAFRLLLRNSPDGGELARWTAVLARGELSRPAFLRKLRASAAGRNIGSRIWGLAGTDPASAPFRLPRIPESSAPFAEKPIYRVAEFMIFHDEEFVVNAYRGILRRAPDQDGLAHFLGRLRDGTLSKIELLGRLRYSREGRAAGVAVKGLAVPLALRTLRHVPLLGRAVAIIQYVGRLPDLARNIERLQNDFMRTQFEAARTINNAHAQIESRLLTVQEASLDTGYALESSMVRLEERIRLRADDRRFAEIRTEVEAITDRARALEIALTRATERLDRADGALREQVTALRDLGAQFVQATTALSELTALHNEQRHHAELLATHVRVRDESLDRILGPLDRDPGNGQTVPEMLAAMRREIIQQQRSIEGRRAAPELEHAETPPANTHVPLLSEAQYESFEDRFRGSEDEVRARLAVYLPVLEKVAAGTPEGPVLDVGCGRGEWLELLRDKGLIARGIDVNSAVVERCQHKGLQAIEAEALAYLATVPSATLGGVTAMHVIEHMSFADMLRFFDEVARVLRPGGIGIFETPNPENLVVGACTFYYDFTHVRPLPPEPLRFVALARGFDRVEIMRLNPFADALDLGTGDREAREQINRALFGPRDFALITHKS